MPEFAYVALDADGRELKGSTRADDRISVLRDLRAKGLTALRVESAQAETVAEATPKPGFNPMGWLWVRSIDLELSMQQLSVMLRNGLNLLTALETVAEQSERPKMARVWERVSVRIQEGGTLADAMAKEKCFPELAIQLVRLGEKTGTLDVVLNRAVDAMERKRMLRSSLLGALAYPLVVLLAAMGVSLYMVISVIPKLRTFISHVSHRKLPAMTQLLVDITDWMQVWLPWMLLGGFITLMVMAVLYSWPPGRREMDRLLLRIPIIGRLVRLYFTALVARALGVLVRSGVMLLDGLDTVKNLVSNRYLAERLGFARDDVARGRRLADALDQPNTYMPMLARMTAIGEMSGALDDILDEVATFHERQLEAAIKRFSAMIEPTIIVIVGGIVGFVYISFFLALFAAGGA